MRSVYSFSRTRPVATPYCPQLRSQHLRHMETSMADLQSIQVNYGGVSKTSTLYTSAYNGSTNYAIQRWIQSIQYASNQSYPGGAEPFNSFIRSPYYFFAFSRDRMDSSSFVSVQAVFNSAQEQNTNMFIVAFYTRLIRSEYSNGILQQLTAVNA